MRNSTVSRRYNTEFILCSCKCGNKLSKYDKRGDERKFIDGHQNKGRKHTEETKRKFSESHKGKKLTEEHKRKLSQSCKGINSGEKHYAWKGENLTSIKGIHLRLNRLKLKPKFCEICGLNPPRDLSNKDHKYSLNLEDYWYLCRGCHIKYDHRENKNRKAK